VVGRVGITEKLRGPAAATEQSSLFAGEEDGGEDTADALPLDLDI
jgi:hypothetical protein